MKRVYVIYDDHQMPGDEIKTITGAKSYGETILKRVTLKDRTFKEIEKEKYLKEIICFDGSVDDAAFLASLPDEKDATFIHLYSNFCISSDEEFKVLMMKAEFVIEDYVAYCDGKPAACFLSGSDSYKENFATLKNRKFEADSIENSAFMDLSQRANFLAYITGGFDARFFNALNGDEYTVTKKSTKKEKIKAEYEFYYLLPDDMKMWFVMPYDYKEDEKGASYTMERYHMTDIAIRFVHGAVDAEELRDILDKLFYFIKLRDGKEVTDAEGKTVADDLYIEKLKARMVELKGYKEYEQFDSMIKMGTDFDSIDGVVEKYISLYNQLAKANRKYNQLVVGHGDLCFSNILYSKEAEVLKLIDPKGATKKEDLYTDPYYDLAKLSHSICGSYDFFNTGLYDISIGRDLKLELSVDTDNEAYKDIFKQFLQTNGFDYSLVRLYEASLFLSMLPYHMDQPGKVFGFLLNAINILSEVETCIKG